MQWFRDWKVAKKVASLAVVLLVFMLGIGSTGYLAGHQMANQAQELYNDRLLPIQWLNTSRAYFRAIEANAWQLILAPLSPQQQKDLLEDIEKRTMQTDKHLADYGNTKLDDYERDILPKLQEEIKRYGAERERAVALALSGKKQEAHAYFIEKAMPRLVQANAYIRDLVDYNEKTAEELKRSTDAMAASFDRITIGVTLFALVFGAWIAWTISRIIVQPLREMLNSIARDDDGYITIQKVSVSSSDEVGELARGLNDFTEQVRSIIRSVGGSAEQVAAASEELTASSEQSALTTNQVAASITEVAASTEEQVSAVNDAMAVIEQMSAGIQEISTNASLVAGTAQKTASAADHGGKAVAAAIGQMANIEQTVGFSARVVAELGERSAAIGQIIDTISGIAGQTNLLALNAAIEAARAGEQGRGFAVVAEEVRKLAEQSQDAARQIADLIGRIQADTGRAVEAMDKGAREVKVGTEVVNGAGNAFREIVSLINQVTGQVQEISAAIQQMAGGSEQIVQAVRSIDRLSKDVAGQTQTVSAATQEQSASMEEIAASSESLAKMAQDLQTVIHQIKV
ncbi:HAMP domain-containing protein [Heliobacterium undosum]|uniref:HAMP domain-containing protein n=1 Tax=Heliomicrobium undosum TaxID=121734 RepID=A0A845L377_9FIRM|nr:methyl-accepting chemotaxis protein [Heliomicrobium undosum]MZP29569.1 HAMP domain-containing protein [Heliomicrobium undosum]